MRNVVDVLGCDMVENSRWRHCAVASVVTMLKVRPLAVTQCFEGDVDVLFVLFLLVFLRGSEFSCEGEAGPRLEAIGKVTGYKDW